MIKSWWGARAEREKKILTAGAMVVLLIALYGFVIFPLNEDIKALKLTFAESQQQLYEMERMSHEIGKGTKPLSVTPSEFIHLLQQAFPAIKVSMQNNTVILQVKQVSFASLIAFLQIHAHGYIIENIALKKLSAQRGMVEGLVSLKLK